MDRDQYSPLRFYMIKADEDNVMCYQELCHIVEGTEAQVYVDEFKQTTDFRAAWIKLYNNYLGKGAQNTLAAELESKILHLKYSGPCKGFMFATYVEWHKATYQAVLALAKKMDYVAYDPGTRVRHFMNGITNPLLNQAKLLLCANPDKYATDFDAPLEYLTNQVSHQRVNQRLNIAAVGQGTRGFKMKDEKGNNLKMPAVSYSFEQWAQLSSAQKASIRKHLAGGNAGGGQGHDHKRQRANRKQGSAELKALAASVAALTNNVNIMAVKMGSGDDSSDGNNEPPDEKMSANAKNPALTKTKKGG